MTFLLQHLDREFMKEMVLEEESMSIIGSQYLSNFERATGREEIDDRSEVNESKVDR